MLGDIVEGVFGLVADVVGGVVGAVVEAAGGVAEVVVDLIPDGRKRGTDGEDAGNPPAA